MLCKFRKENLFIENYNFFLLFLKEKVSIATIIVDRHHQMYEKWIIIIRSTHVIVCVRVQPVSCCIFWLLLLVDCRHCLLSTCFFSRSPSLSLSFSLARSFSQFGLFCFISNELVSLALIVQFYIYTHIYTSLSVINGVFFHILFRIFVASSILCIWWLNEKKRKRSREARDVMRARKKTEIKIGGATETAIAEEARWIPLSDFDFSSLSSSCVCLLRIAVDAALSICQVE